MRNAKKLEIWLIKDVNDYYDPTTGEAISFYVYVDSDDNNTEILCKDANQATLEELVQLCDQDAEDVNAHDYCGSHRLLAALLYKQVGRPTATNIMRDIAYRRGLHGMNGLCGLQDSFESLAVGVAGKDWFGSFGE